MSGFSLDDSGEARLAIAEIFRDHGLAGLDDEPLVGRLLPDLLPESPRESSLLKSAAGAKVGQMLTDRFQAGIPADAAVRDVATILAGRLAFDANACLWIVSEYALVLGQPVDLSPAKGAAPATAAQQAAAQQAAVQQAAAQQAAQQAAALAAAQQAAAQQAAQQKAAQQKAAQDKAAQQKAERKPAAATVGPRAVPEATYADPYAHYAPGRAGAVAVDPRDDNTTSLRVPPAGSKLPLVLGILVTLAVVAAIVVAVVIKLNPSTCTGSSCTTTTTRSTPPVNTSHSSSPSPSPSPTGPKIAALASIMPKDISVADDCVADTNTTLPTATGYYHCTESDTSKMAGLAFWAYQFADTASYNAGVQSFNQFIKFDPNNSGSSCPPASGDTNGLHSWHFKDNPDVAQGIVECYSVNNNAQHVYRWTDDRDLTIMFAESATGQSWSDLSGWWSDNINNTPDA